MKSLAPFSSSSFTFASSPFDNKTLLHKKPQFNPILNPKTPNPTSTSCKTTQNEIDETPQSNKNQSPTTHKMEDYNTAMKRMMRNPYEYHHDLDVKMKLVLMLRFNKNHQVFSGMNYNLITDDLIVGSQPQKPEDVDHLKEEQNVAYILNLQQDGDIAYWGIDLEPIVKRCKQLGIRHMRRPARDFDPDSLRSMLLKAVSSLEWAISEGKGRVYVPCTMGLGRAPAVVISRLIHLDQ
ncbi:putative protein-tyrosine phosphatase [Helianthus annuus]|nr:putative protein-tyrosine phosphatase [Helianthus annuus]